VKAKGGSNSAKMATSTYSLFDLDCSMADVVPNVTQHSEATPWFS
jgi:hypothetical protein